MIEIKTIGVWGFEGAVIGMRMPYESFERIDSKFIKEVTETDNDDTVFSVSLLDDLGKNDLALAKKLIRSGSEHRKFLRMIHIQAEVKAPRFWWQEASTYKFMEMNSSSTMHLITKRELKFEDFSHDATDYNLLDWIEGLNGLIKTYNREEDDEKKKRYFREIKQLLPESFNQLRMIDTNYECLLSIYHQRKNHRLSEWHTFCDWIKSLPYMEEFLEAME